MLGLEHDSEKILLTDGYRAYDPFSKACSYAFKLEDGLRLFLGDPEIPKDNNHTERAIRPIVLGRKNWLFTPKIK